MKAYISYKETVMSEEYGPGDGGDWDYSWSSTSYFETLGANITEPEGWDYETFDLDFDVKPGDVVYTLTVIYSDGNTFGHSVGNGEIFRVFASPEKAEKAEELLWSNRKSYSITFESESGKPITLSNPGVGYFETLDEIRVESFIVGA